MKTIDVVAGIIQDGPKVLLARRKPGSHLAGYWEFPGGKIEAGETAEACLERELKEELGLLTQTRQYIGQSIFDYGTKKIRLLGYMSSLLHGVIRLESHDMVEWVPFENVLEMRLAPADIPLARALLVLSRLPRLTEPKFLLRREEVLQKPCPVPDRPGVYAWYFKEIPPAVPSDGCFNWDGLQLLYVGISPKMPPLNGGAASRQTLKKRIRYHYRGNAEGSTLRLTLGCLLADTLGIQLRRVGKGVRMTFGAEGEAKLSEWMEQNALVTWLEHEKPWEHEDELIATGAFPLNLKGNKAHPFWHKLSEIRANAKHRARELPIL